MAMAASRPELPPTHNPSEGEIVAPARSYEVVSRRTGLLILPGLWKTEKPVSHRPLDGANGCAAHEAQQALLLVSPSERVE